eukprot:jgi/Bigna1/85813/estExt_fgenesh1_pg.C_60182
MPSRPCFLNANLMHKISREKEDYFIGLGYILQSKSSESLENFLPSRSRLCALPQKQAQYTYRNPECPLVEGLAVALVVTVILGEGEVEVSEEEVATDLAAEDLEEDSEPIITMGGEEDLATRAMVSIPGGSSNGGFGGSASFGGSGGGFDSSGGFGSNSGGGFGGGGNNNNGGFGMSGGFGSSSSSGAFGGGYGGGFGTSEVVGTKIAFQPTQERHQKNNGSSSVELHQSITKMDQYKRSDKNFEELRWEDYTNNNKGGNNGGGGLGGGNAFGSQSKEEEFNSSFNDSSSGGFGSNSGFGSGGGFGSSSGGDLGSSGGGFGSGSGSGSFSSSGGGSGSFGGGGFDSFSSSNSSSGGFSGFGNSSTTNNNSNNNSGSSGFGGGFGSDSGSGFGGGGGFGGSSSSSFDSSGLLGSSSGSGFGSNDKKQSGNNSGWGSTFDGFNSGNSGGGSGFGGSSGSDFGGFGGGFGSSGNSNKNKNSGSSSGFGSFGGSGSSDFSLGGSSSSSGWGGGGGFSSNSSSNFLGGTSSSTAQATAVIPNIAANAKENMYGITRPSAKIDNSVQRSLPVVAIRSITRGATSFSRKPSRFGIEAQKLELMMQQQPSAGKRVGLLESRRYLDRLDKPPLPIEEKLDEPGELPTHSAANEIGYLGDDGRVHPIQDVPDTTLENLKYFTLDNEHGTITWLDPIDVRGLNFDKIVSFGPRRVAMDPILEDDDTNNTRSTEEEEEYREEIARLNAIVDTKARITMKNVEPVKDINLDKYEKRLRKVCAKRGATFEKYDREKRTWSFIVNDVAQ